MSTLQFPDSPTLDQEYTFGEKTWKWNGTKWLLTGIAQIIEFDPVFGNSPGDPTVLDFVDSTNAYGAAVFALAVDNDFVYVGGQTSRDIKKWHKGNLVFVGNSANAGGDIRGIVVESDFIYVGAVPKIIKYHTANLVESINTTSNLSGVTSISNITTDNDFIYSISTNGSLGFSVIEKFHKSNLVFVDNTNAYGTTAQSIAIDNDFIYAGGAGTATENRDVKKYHKGNLAFVGNTNNYGGTIAAVAVDNDFIYAGGTSNTIGKWHKGNLVFVDNTNSAGNAIRFMVIDNDFIYAAINVLNHAKKWYKNNLAFVENTSTYGARPDVIAIDDENIYVAGLNPPSDVKKYQNGKPGAVNGTIVFDGNNYIREDLI